MKISSTTIARQRNEILQQSLGKIGRRSRVRAQAQYFARERERERERREEKRRETRFCIGENRHSRGSPERDIKMAEAGTRLVDENRSLVFKDNENVKRMQKYTRVATPREPVSPTQG